MGPGTLYGTIKRLLADGLIREVTQDGADGDSERRRYYRLTAVEMVLAFRDDLRERGAVRAWRRAVSDLVPSVPVQQAWAAMLADVILGVVQLTRRLRHRPAGT